MSDLQWHKASYSEPASACVEVAKLSDGTRFVRHSKNPGGGTLTFTRGEWDAFLKGARAGEFD